MTILRKLNESYSNKDQYHAKIRSSIPLKNLLTKGELDFFNAIIAPLYEKGTHPNQIRFIKELWDNNPTINQIFENKITSEQLKNT